MDRRCQKWRGLLRSQPNSFSADSQVHLEIEEFLPHPNAGVESSANLNIFLREKAQTLTQGAHFRDRIGSDHHFSRRDNK